MPLYLLLSGAGTGKSRNAVNCSGDEDEELREKLRNAWVFHTSFENGTSLRPSESDPLTAIGTRMLYQLLPEKAFDEIDYKEPNPFAVLKRSGRGKGTEGYYSYPNSR
jgi:hypothetical protein